MYSAQKVRAARSARKVDDLLRVAFEQTRPYRTRFMAFQQMISHIRSASRMIGPYRGTGYVGWAGAESLIAGLVNLAAHHRYWIRPVIHWQPNSFSQRAQFSSLARHLLAKAPVPQFMDYVWLNDNALCSVYRRWFRHLAAGNNIRGIATEERLTKSEAKRFLLAPDHFNIPQALEWARRPAASRAKEATPVYPAGISRRRLKRWTAYRVHPQRDAWRRIGVADFVHHQTTEDKEPETWFIRQIRNPDELVAEGVAMRHCVGGYVDSCDRCETSIWSMERKRSGRRERMLTVEVKPHSKLVWEALGYENRNATAEEVALLRLWAAKEGLVIPDWIQAVPAVHVVA